MNSRSNLLVSTVTAVFLVVPGLAAAQTTTPTTMDGVIVSHNGNHLVVRVGGADTKVTLTDTTKIQASRGLVGVRKDDHPASDLIKGLAVTMQTVQNGDVVDATSVTFKPDDLKTARAVEAGTAEAKEKILAEKAEADKRQAENERRLSQVGQFDTKASTRVLFKSGSVAINDQGKQALQDIAKQAMSEPGYLVRVVGHADTTGNAAANQRLSDQRASAVTAYLLKDAKLPPNKMMSATGLGATVPVEDNASSASQAENRRVTVFVVVSKASQKSTP
jgi:outer membrane protein OmpA-like peptidoglycan-associated protein